MNILFKKNEDGQIIAKMQNGENVIDFDYVVLLKNLMATEQVSITFESGIEEIEQEKINELFEKIKQCVNESSSEQEELIS